MKIRSDRLKNKPVHIVAGNCIVGFSRVSTDLQQVRDTNKVYPEYNKVTKRIGFQYGGGNSL